MELPLKESLQTEGSSATPCVHINIPDDAKLKRLGWATNCLVVFWVLLSLFLTLHVWSCFCVYLCFFWLTLFCLLFLAVFFVATLSHFIALEISSSMSHALAGSRMCYWTASWSFQVPQPAPRVVSKPTALRRVVSRPNALRLLPETCPWMSTMMMTISPSCRSLRQKKAQTWKLRNSDRTTRRSRRWAYLHHRDLLNIHLSMHRTACA